MWCPNPRPSRSLEGEEGQDGRGGRLRDTVYQCHTRNTSSDTICGSCEKLQDLCMCGPCGSPVYGLWKCTCVHWALLFGASFLIFIGLCLCVMEKREAISALNSRTVKGRWFLSLLRTILVNIALVCVRTMVEPGAFSFICGS